MIKHKICCEFKDFDFSLYAIDHNGPDQELTVSEKGIQFEANVHKGDDKKSFFISFNYCPCCGRGFTNNVSPIKSC